MAMDEIQLFQRLSKRLLGCLSPSSLLDELMDSGDIFRALEGFPEEPSITLGLYALNRQRVVRRLASLPPPETLTTELFDEAATQLCLVYLRRIDFILSFRESGDKVSWKINLQHPFSRTLESLEVASPALHRFAQFVVAFEAAKAQVSAEKGLPSNPQDGGASWR
jgi:hypothetical protein